MYVMKNARTIRVITAAVAAALTLTMAAAILSDVAAHAATTADGGFTSRLTTSVGAEKFAGMPEATLAELATAHGRTETPVAPAAPAPTRTTVTRKTTTTTSAAPVDENAQAQAILAGLIAKYPILAGTTVSFGDAKGSQAIAYYKSGRIVISPTHTASLSRILNHEVWHIIDWRDNGVIDWGENVPPQ